VDLLSINNHINKYCVYVETNVVVEAVVDFISKHS